MKSRLLTIVLPLAVLACIVSALPVAQAAALVAPAAAPALGDQPVLFIANAGQLDANVRFQLRGTTSSMFLTDDALWLTVVDPQSYIDTHPQLAASSLPSTAQIPPLSLAARPTLRGVNLKLSFVGANQHPQLEPFARSNTHISFFRGRRDQWHPDVPVWGGVRYRELYPGIDLELSGAGGQLEQRLRVQPGADLSKVRLRVEGATSQSIAGDSLRLRTTAGELSMPLFQVESSDGKAIALTAAPALEGSELRAPFARAPQASRAPTIQAALGIGYSTLFGGKFDDIAESIAVDASGAAYVTGYTFSPDFPASIGAFDATCGNDDTAPCNYNGSIYFWDAFVAKLQPAGAVLSYATYYGSDGDDFGEAIAVDADGNAYVTGSTYSSDSFATTMSPTKLQTTGFHSPTDSASRSIAPSVEQTDDIFVAKFNPLGTKIVYGSTLSTTTSGGDPKYDEAYGITLDAAGNVYIVGRSGATSLSFDVLLVKLNTAGALIGTYGGLFGGANNDWANSVAVDASGNAYLTGRTISPNFPVSAAAYDKTCGTDNQCNFDGSLYYYDVFVTKVNPAGTTRLYTTYLGGSQGEGGLGIAVDSSGAAYIAGYTFSATGFPTSTDAFDTSFNGVKDAFVAKLSPDGSTLGYSTYLGGSDADDARSIALDSNSNAYITGLTFSGGFPTTPNGLDVSFNGADDAYVAELNPTGTALIYSTFLGGTSTDEAEAIALGAGDSVYVAGLTGSTDFPVTTGANHPAAKCQAEPNTHPCYDVFVVKLTPVVGPEPHYSRVLVPLFTYNVVIGTYVPPPLPQFCDQFEPNNSRLNTPSPILLGTQISAKICQDEGPIEPEAPPPTYQDNYQVISTSAASLHVTLTLPSSLLNHIALAVYDRAASVYPLGGCYIDLVKTAPYTMNCAIPDDGAYIVRLYSSDGAYDNTQPYTLIVTQ